jgi:hypothetical protein
MSGCQLKELEDMLSDVYTTSQFVDTALDSGTDTQLILVKKQVQHARDNALLHRRKSPRRSESSSSDKEPRISIIFTSLDDYRLN